MSKDYNYVVGTINLKSLSQEMICNNPDVFFAQTIDEAVKEC